MRGECEQGAYGQVTIPRDLNFRAVLLDPRLGESVRAHLRGEVSRVWKDSERGVVVATSGTSRREADEYLLVYLPSEALVRSAEEVNRHLGSTSEDIWLLALPDFHVGGLGVHIRGARSGAAVLRTAGNNAPWSVEPFLRDLSRSRATLLSLVPTQLYDLLRVNASPPAHLRAVLIGGGALSRSEYLEGRALGWPLLPSYGCTEACSQIATAPLASLEEAVQDLPALRVLPHWEVRSAESGLEISGPSLLCAYFACGPQGIVVRDPRVDGWYATGDLVELLGSRSLIPHGRSGDLVKVGGAGVSLQELSLLLRDIRRTTALPGDAAIAATPDPRLGAHIVLYATEDELGAHLQHEINQRVLPHARIREVISVREIPTTPLGKPRLGSLCGTALGSPRAPRSPT